MPRPINPELIEKAKMMYATGSTQKEIGEELGVNRKTVGQWVRGELLTYQGEGADMQELQKEHIASCKRKAWGIADKLLDRVEADIDADKWPRRYPPIVQLAMLLKQLSALERADVNVGNLNQTQINLIGEIDKLEQSGVLDRVIGAGGIPEALSGDICDDGSEEPVHPAQALPEAG